MEGCPGLLQNSRMANIPRPHASVEPAPFDWYLAADLNPAAQCGARQPGVFLKARTPLAGLSVSTSKVYSYSQCCDECWDSPNCSAYSFNAATGFCNLYGPGEHEAKLVGVDMVEFGELRYVRCQQPVEGCQLCDAGPGIGCAKCKRGWVLVNETKQVGPAVIGLQGSGIRLLAAGLCFLANLPPPPPRAALQGTSVRTAQPAGHLSHTMRCTRFHWPARSAHKPKPQCGIPESFFTRVDLPIIDSKSEAWRTHVLVARKTRALVAINPFALPVTPDTDICLHGTCDSCMHRIYRARNMCVFKTLHV